jgi:hypothetical protein
VVCFEDRWKEICHCCSGSNNQGNWGLAGLGNAKTSERHASLIEPHQHFGQVGLLKL